MRLFLLLLLLSFAGSVGSTRSETVPQKAAQGEEGDPCSDPNVFCVRIWKPVG